MGQGDRSTGIQWDKGIDPQVYSVTRGYINRYTVGQGDRSTGLQWDKGIDPQVFRRARG